MNGSGLPINRDSRGESRQSSRTPCVSSPARCTLSSRLPVPRKVSASIQPPITIGSLRPSPSKESLYSGRLPKASPPRGTPTIAKRNSLIGINTTAIAPDSPDSPGIRTPRRANFGATGYASHTTTSLAKRTSIPSLTRKPSTSPLPRKSSSSQLYSVTVSTPPRRTSGINVAPPLTRKPSASQLHLSRRPSASQLVRKTSTPQLNSPIAAATPSPTPLRRVVSSNLPSLRPPTISKLPPRPSLSPLRQPSSSHGPRPSAKQRKPAARSKVPPPETPKKVPGAYKVASQALRDTIAKARAAHRANVLANAAKPPTPTALEPLGNDLQGFNFSTDDSSNQVIFGEGGSESVKAHEEQIFLPVVSIALAEPAQPVELAEPVEPVESAESVGPAEPAEPAESAEPAEPVQSAEPVQPVEPGDSVEPGGLVGLGDPADPRE